MKLLNAGRNHMFGLEIGFDKPWYLLLLGLVPILWFLSFRSLTGLGKWRRWIALAIRSLVLLLLICALAEIQILWKTDRMTVLYLLDQSKSIPSEKRTAMMEYAIREVKKHRNAEREDRAGVIVFGSDAKIEIPPFDDDLPSTGLIESYFNLRTDATNLAAALKLAQASFPEDTARRVVVISDGNENLGDARAIARSMADDGIGIDVIPIPLSARNEVAVEKVTLPSDIRKGQTFQANVVVNNQARPTEDNPEGLVSGRLRLTQNVGREEQLIADEEITLKSGKEVFSFRHSIDQSAMFTYKAVFTPDDPSEDLMPENNSATAYTHVRGEGHVLLIEDWVNIGQFDYLISRLREQNLEVTVMPSDQLFSDPVELLEFDTVVLANVPRSSGDPTNQVTAFSDGQIRMLVQNVEQFGCGLVMLGGENSFGAGGWTNTELEKAMPVDFQIKNEKIEAVGALVLMMHASEMAQGNHWQKVVAAEAVKALGPMDYCGLIHWNNRLGGDSWLWADPTGLIRVGNQRAAMLARLDQMAPGDMPQFEPAMQKALAAFGRVTASVKHMIVISDGDPSPPLARTVTTYTQNKIQITTVAVGSHGPAGHRTLQNIATATGGKYYVVTNPKALPRIYQLEARRVSRPLIFEPDGGVKPIVSYPHELLGNIDTESLLRVRGYVMTTIKENAQVEQVLVADKPDDGGKNSTLLATWQNGLGRAVAFTTDAGQRWADTWTSAEYYDKFFGDMIRWSMRPIKNEANFSMATDVRDGRVRLVVTALDKDDEFLNFLNMTAKAIGPDLEPFDVEMRQLSSGRYVGEFAAPDAGSYLFAIMPGGEFAAIRGGVNVPYSSEYLDRRMNEALLTSLVSLIPKDGEPGVVIDGDVVTTQPDVEHQTDTFRQTLARAVSSIDIWQLVMALCVMAFFADVFIRRVHVHFDWVMPALLWVNEKVLGREREPVQDERLARLRSRKAAINEQIDVRRAAARFDPQPDDDAALDAAQSRSLDEVLEDSSATSGKPATESAAAPEIDDEEDSYTSRLLKAKKQAFKDDQK